MKKALAIDMGATSIRGILGWVEDGKLHTEEVMRMEHKAVRKDGRLRWQWGKLIDKIADTVAEHAEEIVSVGVDTWGVDFGLLDEEGKLCADPVSYRDALHRRGYDKAIGLIGGKKLFMGTGTQLMTINTLFQLIELQDAPHAEWKKAQSLLMMPDLVGYMLCGEKAAEETILSTAQVMDLETVRIDDVLLERFGISERMFAPLVQAGTRLGTTKHARIEKLRGLKPVNVIAVCGHDTASAVMLTEAFCDPDCMFLSCGTWSLFGVLSEHAVLTEQAYRMDMTNELGYGQRNMFFRNITGLYLLEKCRAEIEAEQGRKLGFEEITEYVTAHPNASGLIDMDAPQFGADGVCARQEIDAFLKEKGRPLPAENMAYFRIIYESLVEKYAQTQDALEAITGKKYRALHIIGGGARSALLCQMTADRLGVPVTAGPYEATAAGNLIVQLIAEGEIDDLAAGIEMMQRTAEVRRYEPRI